MITEIVKNSHQLKPLTLNNELNETNENPTNYIYTQHRQHGRVKLGRQFQGRQSSNGIMNCFTRNLVYTDALVPITTNRILRCVSLCTSMCVYIAQ